MCSLFEINEVTVRRHQVLHRVIGFCVPDLHNSSNISSFSCSSNEPVTLPHAVWVTYRICLASEVILFLVNFPSSLYHFLRLSLCLPASFFSSYSTTFPFFLKYFFLLSIITIFLFSFLLFIPILNSCVQGDQKVMQSTRKDIMFSRCILISSEIFVIPWHKICDLLLAPQIHSS